MVKGRTPPRAASGEMARISAREPEPEAKGEKDKYQDKVDEKIHSAVGELEQVKKLYNIAYGPTRFKLGRRIRELELEISLFKEGILKVRTLPRKA